MIKLQEIRQDADKMERLIEAMIADFIDKHGICDINISNQLYFHHAVTGEKTISAIEVKINIII